jgi:site-specific recombinase XerD
MASLFKRGKVWYVKFKDSAGQWQNKTCGRKITRAEAEQIERRYSTIELNHLHNAPIRMVILELNYALAEFRDKELLRGQKGDKAASSINREQTTTNNFILYCALKKFSRFSDLTDEEIQGYLDWRRVEKKIMPKTRQEDHRILVKFFEYAKKKNYCADNPAKRVSAPRIEQKKPRYYSEGELSKIFLSAKEPYNSIYRFLYHTGLRSGELCNLEWRDWNEEQKFITIRVMEGNKTKHEEIVYLNPSAMDILKERRATAESFIYVFVNGSRNKLDTDNIYRNLMVLLGTLEIKDACVHTFRHTTASHLAIKGVSLYVIKEILRHKSIVETEIYAHLSKESLKNAMDYLMAA